MLELQGPLRDEAVGRSRALATTGLDTVGTLDLMPMPGGESNVNKTPVIQDRLVHRQPLEERLGSEGSGGEVLDFQRVGCVKSSSDEKHQFDRINDTGLVCSPALEASGVDLESVTVETPCERTKKVQSGYFPMEDVELGGFGSQRSHHAADDVVAADCSGGTAALRWPRNVACAAEKIERKPPTARNCSQATRGIPANVNSRNRKVGVDRTLRSVDLGKGASVYRLWRGRQKQHQSAAIGFGDSGDSS